MQIIMLIDVWYNFIRNLVKVITLSINVVLVVSVFLWGAEISAVEDMRHHNQQVIHVPNELVEFLTREIYDEHWEAQCGNRKHAPLFSREYYEIAPHNLLFFVGLPDYLCDSSNSFVPIVVDVDGNVTWGERMYGEPALVVQDQQQRLWLVTQWAVEASYPLLYRSENGIKWTEIPLPEERDVDCCFEYLNEICFQDEEMRVRFTGLGARQRDSFEFYETFAFRLQQKTRIPQDVLERLKTLTYSNCGQLTDINVFLKKLQEVLTEHEFTTYSEQIIMYANKIQYWSAPLESIMETPKWKRVLSHESINQLCHERLATKGDWFRQENLSNVHFLYEPNRLQIIFPRWL